MINQIILFLIRQNTLTLRAMTADDFESANSYRGWIYPLRYLLAIRYLKIKQNVLKSFRSKKIYPISDGIYKDALVAFLSGKKIITNTRKPFFAYGFSAKLVYPAILIVAIFSLYQLNNWYQTRKIENVLANYLPYYSDLLHQRLMLSLNENTSTLKKINADIEKQKIKILQALPKKDGIRVAMEEQLNKLKDSSVSSEEIILGFKKVNTLFDEKGLKFYLTPKSFSMPCSSLIDAPVEQMMMLKKLESLMSNDNPERCRTTMMTVYKVNQRNQLTYVENGEKSKELPLFHVERIDKVPAVDSALGLTFKDRGIGSIILRKRIKNFAEESVLPALTFQGRNYIIPYWMQGYYEIEEAITKGYKKDLEKIYPNRAERLKVKKVVKTLIKNKNRMQNAKMQNTLETTKTTNDKDIFGNGFDAISVLLGKLDKPQNKKKFKPSDEIENIELLEKLDEILLPSIEYHEAYHQINKKNWITPSWVETTFKGDLTDSGRDHTMEELGAYLAQLANTKEGHNIWLSKLLIFSLNPMTKGQAEYYASSIILTTLNSIYQHEPIAANYNADVEEKTQIYKMLINLEKDELQELSKRAYEALFERKVPELLFN